MQTTLTSDVSCVRIIVNTSGNPPGKLAEAELHFPADGLFGGMKLIGFAIWERRGGPGRTVTFPARNYTVNGERRSFALLRPVADVAGQNAVRDLILRAYEEHEAQAGRNCRRASTRAESSSARRAPWPPPWAGPSGRRTRPGRVALGRGDGAAAGGDVARTSARASGSCGFGERDELPDFVGRTFPRHL